MKVFRLTFDINRYQYFLTDPLKGAKRLWMDGSPTDGAWVPPSVYILYPKRPKADFFQSNDSVLIANPRATEALYHQLAWAGEVLPLPYGDEVYSLTNVTKCIDVLDREKTIHR